MEERDDYVSKELHRIRYYSSNEIWDTIPYEQLKDDILFLHSCIDDQLETFTTVVPKLLKYVLKPSNQSEIMVAMSAIERRKTKDQGKL